MPAAAAAAVLAAPLAGRCAYAASRLRTPVRRAAASVVPRAMPFRARCGGAVAPASSARRRAARGSSRAVTARASADDEIYRVMSANQEVSVVAVVGTKVVADAVSRHKTAPTATAALGRTMLSALLLGVFKGDDETVQITFKGDGPIGTIMAISDNRGMVKGMCANPSADPPLRPDGKLNVGAAVGKCVPSHTGFHTTPFAR
jgi:molecular chaperone Hsp33|eukprot:29905-Pelagococcus_subviridis.AAC.10